MLHVCAKRDDRWKRLPASCLIATQHPKPEGLPSGRWVQNISPDWYESGEQMAQAIEGGLRSGEPPRLVMMDELKSSTVVKIAVCAKTISPEFRGRFGAYLVNGSAVSYSSLNPAIDALLDAGAVIAPEMYLKASEYEKHGSTYMERNVIGTTTHARLGWLTARRASRGSSSPIVGLVGLTTTYLDRPNSGQFIRTIREWWERLTPGPLGAWKWDQGTAVGVRPDWPGWGVVNL